MDISADSEFLISWKASGSRSKVKDSDYVATSQLTKFI